MELVDSLCWSDQRLNWRWGWFNHDRNHFRHVKTQKPLFSPLKPVFEELGVELPIMISGTITDASGRTLSGQTTEAFYNSLRHAKPLTFGLNCALGPKELRQYVEQLSKISETYVSVHPNAGLPNAFGGYDLGAEEMAAHLKEWAESGFVNIVGGVLWYDARTYQSLCRCNARCCAA